jgi:biopolymer transport protein ExbB
MMTAPASTELLSQFAADPFASFAPPLLASLDAARIFFYSASTMPDGSVRTEWIGSVIIWILIAMSLASVGMIISGALTHRAASIAPPRAFTGFGGGSEGRSALEAAAALPCDAGRIARAASEAWTHGRRELVDAAERAAIECAARRFRTLEPLHVLAQISPMIGLFGTVYGMIVAFQAVAASGGQADPALLAGGIGTALVTTFWGLIVAVPALLAYALLRNRVDAVLADALDRVLSAAKDAPESGSAVR